VLFSLNPFSMRYNKEIDPGKRNSKRKQIEMNLAELKGTSHASPFRNQFLLSP
jgi:hypothetical protein